MAADSNAITPLYTSTIHLKLTNCLAENMNVGETELNKTR